MWGHSEKTATCTPRGSPRHCPHLGLGLQPPAPGTGSVCDLSRPSQPPQETHTDCRNRAQVAVRLAPGHPASSSRESLGATGLTNAQQCTVVAVQGDPQPNSHLRRRPPGCKVTDWLPG